MVRIRNFTGFWSGVVFDGDVTFCFSLLTPGRKAAEGRMPLAAGRRRRMVCGGLLLLGGERTTTALRAGYSIVGKVGVRSVAASEFNGFRVP